MDTKTTSIVGYLTWIGLLVAYLAGDKEGAKFHLNQSLLIILFQIACSVIFIIPILGWIVGIAGHIFLFVCWIMGLIAAINQEEKRIPLIGNITILK